MLLQHSNLGLEIGVNNMEAWIHQDLYEQSRLVVVV